MSRVMKCKATSWWTLEIAPACLHVSSLLHWAMPSRLHFGVLSYLHEGGQHKSSPTMESFSQHRDSLYFSLK